MDDRALIDRLMSAVVIRPGDTLVLGVSERLTMEEWDDLRRRVEDYLPGVRCAVIEAAQLLVYRPDAEVPDGA